MDWRAVALACLLAGLGAAACASFGLVPDENDGVRISGNGRRGTAYLPWDAMDWSAALDRYCAQFGRYAEPAQVEPHRVTFRCVDEETRPAHRG